MRIFVASLFMLSLLAGCLSGGNDKNDDSTPVAPEPLAVTKVNAAALIAELRAFANQYQDRAGNSAQHEGSRVWLYNKFESYGLTPERQDYTNGIDQANIMGIKWGEKRDEWIVVGAHYDTFNKDCRVNGVEVPNCPYRGTISQGMYDDGSGTFLTLHLAQAFANVNTTYTMVFVAFDGEERGLQGSQAFVEHYALGNSSHGPITIHAMLNLDMFGLNWPSVDAPIYFDSNAPQLDDAVRGIVADMGMPASEIKYQGIRLGRSDYAHFFTLGVPTGFFISSFEEYQMPANIPADGQNPAMNAYPFWHRADTWETMMLMAGSEADVIAGFQAAADLALGVLLFMNDPTVVYDVDVE
jgi:Zn-dependent M28 family amino/carboxypeptidase